MQSFAFNPMIKKTLLVSLLATSALAAGASAGQIRVLGRPVPSVPDANPVVVPAHLLPSGFPPHPPRLPFARVSPPLFVSPLAFPPLFPLRPFPTSRAVERALMILGCLAGQSSPFFWIATHRIHHRHSDAEGDPHSPHGGREGLFGGLVGFFHAHMGWLATTQGMERGRRYWRALDDDRRSHASDRPYMVWVGRTRANPFAAG